MYGIHFRDELDEPVARELDALIARLKGFLLAEHNEDGSHNFNPDGELNDAIVQIIDGSQAQGHWWKTGPWWLNDPDAADFTRAIIRPTNPAAGTYNDYAPSGIDTAVGVSIEPAGAVIITGIRNARTDRDRLLLLRNRDGNHTVTLKHDNAGSLDDYRFEFVGNADVRIGPRESLWIYYDSTRDRWTLTASGNGSTHTATLALTEAQLESLFTTPITIVLGVGPNRVIYPVHFSVELTVTSTSATSPTFVLYHEGDTTAQTGLANPAWNSTGIKLSSALGTAQNHVYGSFDPRDVPLQVALSANPNSSFVGSAIVSVAYHVVTTTQR